MHINENTLWNRKRSSLTLHEILLLFLTQLIAKCKSIEKINAIDHLIDYNVRFPYLSIVKAKIFQPLKNPEFWFRVKRFLSKVDFENSAICRLNTIRP